MSTGCSGTLGGFMRAIGFSLIPSDPCAPYDTRLTRYFQMLDSHCLSLERTTCPFWPSGKSRSAASDSIYRREMPQALSVAVEERVRDIRW